MAKKKQTVEDQNLENVQEALNTTSVWIEKNQNKLTWAVTIVVALVVGALALNTYVIKPKAVEVNDENAKAVAYFMQGDWEKALNGDDAECIGFQTIADEYKCFQSGKLAALYAGVCYYQMGQFEDAVEYLDKFSADDLTIEPAALQLMGDAYVQMEDYAKAVKAFEGAAESGNELIAPMSLKKAGFVYLELGNKAAAKKAFETIKTDYPASTEAQNIEAYIAIAE
ncbi:MAG: tetratricopeptide repeat protein [Paludibacteraceae bacterium]|nr:tetratricopeptide repeat protein [Paludibacteraceae bacterium]